MGYELQKLMNMYGVSTSTMAAAPQMPGAAPTALAEGATAEQQAKYATDKAAFDENVRKYGLDKAQYDQYAKDYQNRLANTNLYNQAQFSTTGANVPAFTTYSDAQKAALGYGPAVTPTAGAPTAGEGEYKLAVMPKPGPQDFTGTGQGGLNQQIQNYMSTNPSTPDLNAYMTRYGITDYDIRNAMGTGTTYGAPQWTDMLASPVYGAPITTMPVNTTGGTTMPVDTGGTTGTTTTGGTTQGGGGRDRDGGDRRMAATSAPSSGGYTGLRDMFDGGGPGRSGPRGGYTGLRDMFDGGGPGRSGPRGGYTGLRDMFDGGGPGRSRPKAEGGYIQNYAQGGTVRGYQRGGPPGTLYGGAGDDMMMGRPANDMLATAPAPVAEDPQDAMRAMLESYIGEPVDYSSQIAAATERRAAEQKALEELLMGQMNAQDSAPESKAELYLRLAAAFGAPTKTGHFSENLGLVGQTMADELAARSERERAAREKKLGVQTELQKMRLDAAGEEVDALQEAQKGETQYRRDLAKDLIKDYMDSGKPQTEAAKMASDMGLTPGTPEYNEKVREIIALDIAEKKSLIDARLAMRDNVPAAFEALDYQARAAGFLPESEGGDGSYEEFMATRGSGLAAEARAAGAARGEAAAAAPGKQALFELIEFQVNDLLNDPYLPNMLGYNAYLPNVSPESKRVQSKMEQISGGAFLQARQLLKGGGAITDFESKKAESAFIRMNEAMNEEDFRKAMNDFLDAVRAGLPKLEAGDTASSGADLGLSDEDLQYIGGN